MAKDIIICKLTGEEGLGMDSHIIPRAFYGLKDEQGNFREGGIQIIMDKNGLRESKRPIGTYDKTIVTKRGEDHFMLCDDYAARFFLQDFDSKPWARHLLHDNLRTPSAEHYDADMIRRFCMTVLWRSHATTQDFYSEVDLGPHEERLRNLIENNDVGDPGDFSVILWDWQDSERHKWPVESPRRYKIGGGINFYEFRSAGVNFSIKVDSQPITDDTSIVGIGDNLEVFLRKRSRGSAMDREFLRRINEKYEVKPL